MEISFKNKVVLVTGASAGIGEAIAILFAKYQAKLALVGRSDGNLKAVAKQCADLSKEAPLVILADLATDEGCETVAKRTIEHFGKSDYESDSSVVVPKPAPASKLKKSAAKRRGSETTSSGLKARLDVLINNAGIGARTTIQTTDMETFDRVFNLDVRGVYNLTRLLVKELIKTKGNIINISSIAGTKVVVGSLPYGMAKAALDHFTRLTALELGPTGVRVNAVLPGITVSKFVTRITKLSEEEYGNWLESAKPSIPMGEVCTGEDIAQTVVHLASDRSRLVTGALVTVDGGALYGEMGHMLKKLVK